MPALRSHVPSPTAPADASTTWQELEDVLAELGQLARSAAAPDEFYQRMLGQTAGALGAIGGSVWLRQSDGALHRVAELNWPAGEHDADVAALRNYESALLNAAAQGRAVRIPAGPSPDNDCQAQSLNAVRVAAPVQLRLASDEAAVKDAASTLAIVEIVMQSDAGPAVYRGAEQFLDAVCGVAADYHAFRELRRLQHDASCYEQLLRFSQEVHAGRDLMETAFAVANDGRRIVGCDRLSVLLVMPRRGSRILAASGAGRVDRRTTAARQLEELAELVRRTNEPAYYVDGQSDALPPVAAALERHVEASHARQVAVIPLTSPDKRSDEAPRTNKRHAPGFILVAEHFDATGSLDRQRLAELGEVCSTALAAALEMHELPLAWLLRPLGNARRRAIAHWPRYVFALAIALAAVFALAFVPADFNIEAGGTLQPVVRHDVFAPRSGLVDEVFVAHGEDVSAGQPLAQLRDPVLELELKRVHGELETALRQIDAVRATKTSRAVRDASAVETYRLSAEEREIDQRIANLRRELELLTAERQKLLVVSPIAGRVLTWDVSHRLTARPVERGALLVSVANLSADWQLELDVPDDRIGHVFAAQQKLRPDLLVRFRLSSEDSHTATANGHVTKVSQTADVDVAPGSQPSPKVRVEVAFDADRFDDAVRRELRPGVSVQAQIVCGRRPVGYVWLHDIWDAVIGWVRF